LAGIEGKQLVPVFQNLRGDSKSKVIKGLMKIFGIGYEFVVVGS
jgi:hypothetical protein